MTDYATTAELKGWMNIADDLDDDILEVAISSASALIDQWTDNSISGATPATIKLACLIQAGRFVNRRYALFGVAGSPDMGNEIRLLAKLDPDVQVLIRPYKVWWGAASGTG